MSAKVPDKVAAKNRPPSGSTKIPVSGKTNGTLSRSSSACTLTSVADNKSESGDVGGDGFSEFNIGDQIFVNGSKPGILKFIGETQFAPGLWAGVMLDDAVGKNDGSVGGVRYFDCEPKKGIFTRPHRLTREAGSPNVAGDTSICESNPTPIKTKTVAVTPKAAGSTPAAIGNSTPSRSSSISSRLKVGERVVVNATSGVKAGVLRYVGSAEFAPGDWAGIELDEPLGKNDGSVAGKRYFTCKMKHGLFAPLHKVLPKPCGTVTPRLCSAGTSPLHQRSNSRESLNSSVSSSSGARLGRVKLGVTSLTNTQKSTRSAATTVTATNTALQEALKEKEEHIEQLLKERDLERAEVARAASQVDEAEQKLAQLQVEHQRYVEENEESITHLKNLLEVSDSEMKNIKALLDDEKRKVEDLQFRVEEETIAKSDLEALLQQGRQKIKLLEESVQKDEKFNNESSLLENEVMKYRQDVKKLEALVETNNSDLASTKQQLFQVSQDLEKANGEVTALTTLLKQRDTAIADLESKQNAMTKELELKGSQIAELTSSLEKGKQQLQDLLGQNVEQQVLQERICKLENELNVVVQGKAEAAKQEIETLEKTLSEREDMLTSLRHSMEEKDVQIQNLKKELTEAVSKVQEIEAYRDVLNEEMAQLKSSNAMILKENDEKVRSLSEELERATQSLKVKESSEIESESHMTLLRNNLNAKDATISELKSQLLDMEQSVQHLKKENLDCVRNLEQDIEKLKEEHQVLICEHEKKTQQLCEELKNSSESSELKAKECLTIQAEFSVLQQTLEGKDQELAKKESLLRDANNQITVLNEQAKESAKHLIDKVSELEKNWKTEQQKSVQLSEEIKSTSESLELKAKECLAKQEELSVLQKNVEEKNQELVKNESLLRDANNQITILTEEKNELEKQLMNQVSELEKNLTEKEQKLQQLFDENKRLTAEVKEKLDVLKENEQIALSLEKSLKEKDISYAKLNTQLQDAQKELMILSKDKTETHGLLQQQIAQIRSETDAVLKEKDKQLEGLQQEVSRLTHMVQEKTSVLAERESQIESFKKEMQEKEMQVCELTAIIQDSQRNFEQLTEQSNKNVSALETRIAEFKAEQERVLVQKDESLKLEAEKFTTLIKEKDNMLQKSKAELSAMKNQLEEKDAKVKCLELQIEESRVQLQSLAESDLSLHQDFQTKISSLQDQCDRLQKEKEELARLQQESQELQKNLEKEKSNLAKDNIEHKAVIQDREAKLDSVQLEVNRMKVEFANHKADLQQKLDVSEMELKAMQELKEQLELQHVVLEDLQKELQASENEKGKLLSQLQQTGVVVEEKDLLEKKLVESQKTLEDLTTNKAELEKQIHVFEKLLESNQCLLLQKEKELQNVSKQLEPLQKEAIQSEKLRITIKRLEEEKFILEDKVKKLQSTTSITPPNANIADSELDKEEKDALLSQVDFLNSIIVDMRNKNDELTARIAILEAGPVFEENDLNLNGIKRTVAPRLFCDICDMFDLHDTEDCPKQSNYDESEEIPHSRHHGNRYEERPYCSNCEVFGHWTANCDDQETF